MESRSAFEARPRRRIVPGAALAVVTTLVAGCSNSDRDRPPPAPASTTTGAGSSPPASAPAPTSAPSAPAPNALRFEMPGLFHVPRAGDLVARHTWKPPAGTYRRLELDMEVVNTGWSAANPTGTHNVIWLVRNRNRDMIGYINVKGGGRNAIFFKHGFGQRHVDKPRETGRFAMRIGELYRVRYVYDTDARRIDLTVTDSTGATAASVRGVPDTPAIAISARDEILMHCGFDGSNPNEPPTLGWSYRNLSIELFP